MKKYYSLLIISLVLFAFPLFGQTFHVVEMQDSEFVPENITINEGDTVMWSNVGDLVHTSTSGTNCQSDGTWDSGNVQPGNSYSLVFTDAGDYPYYCIPHCALDMTGNVTVESTTDIDDGPVSQTELTISPNPAESKTRLELKTRRTGEVQVSVFNLMGKRLQVPAERTMEAGDRIAFDLNLNDLIKGMYFVQVKMNGEVQTTRRFIVQ